MQCTSTDTGPEFISSPSQYRTTEIGDRKLRVDLAVTESSSQLPMQRQNSTVAYIACLLFGNMSPEERMHRYIAVYGYSGYGDYLPFKATNFGRPALNLVPTRRIFLCDPALLMFWILANGCFSSFASSNISTI